MTLRTAFSLALNQEGWEGRVEGGGGGGWLNVVLRQTGNQK